MHTQIDPARQVETGGPHCSPAARHTGPGRSLLGYAAFALSVTVASVGAGLGVPRLSNEGMVTAAWLGLGLLVTGLALAAWSGWRLLTGVRRRWWLLLLPLLLATAYVAVWTVGQAVAASFPARPELGDGTPATVGLSYRDVTLRPIDDVRLAGWWVPSSNGAAVVLLHGAGSTNRVAADKAFLDAYGARGDVQQGIDRVTYAVAGLLTAAPEPSPLRDSVRAADQDGTPTPMLLIAAGDVQVERLGAAHLEAAAPDAVRTWVVADAGHVQGLQTEPDEWQRQVLDFLDTALIAGGPKETP